MLTDVKEVRPLMVWHYYWFSQLANCRKLSSHEYADVLLLQQLSGLGRARSVRLENCFDSKVRSWSTAYLIKVQLSLLSTIRRSCVMDCSKRWVISVLFTTCLYSAKQYRTQTCTE